MRLPMSLNEIYSPNLRHTACLVSHVLPKSYLHINKRNKKNKIDDFV